MKALDRTAKELLDELNETDETDRLEAKSIRFDTARSLLESVCSFSNEPGLGGGTIVLGFAERDNNAYRQISGLDTLHASYELRGLREQNLIEQKARGNVLIIEKDPLSRIGTPPNKDGNSPNKDGEIQRLCALVGRRCSCKTMRHVLISLCAIRPFTAQELMRLLSRSPNTILPKLSTLVKEKTLAHRYPAMPNHPDQAYMCKR